MKYFVARSGRPHKIFRPEWYYRFTDEQLRAANEPFLIHPDSRFNQVPLIRLFGPGFYWRVSNLDDGTSAPAIVGQGLDPWDYGDLMAFKETMEVRRSGHVYGRWFSEFQPLGEWGLYHFDELIALSHLDYDEQIAVIRQTKEPPHVRAPQTGPHHV